MTLKTYWGSPGFYRKALAIAVPVMLQALVQNLVSLVDNFMVSGLGDVKMSGVNVSNQVLFVFMIALMTLSSAGAIFMSQFNGANDREGMKQAFLFKFHAGLFLTAIVTGLAIFLPRQILTLLVNTNSQREAVLEQGRAYISIILFTFVPMTLSIVIGSSLREIGKVHAPLYISVSAALVNTFLNWVFIYGNLGAPRLEVRGAALATVIARAYEMIVFIIYINRTKPPFYVRLRELYRVNMRVFVIILQKSGFIALSEMSWVLTETAMTAVFNGRGGAEIISGMAAGWAIANIFFLVFQGLHTSIGVIVGGTLGKNELDQARHEARWLRSGAIVAGTVVAMIESFSVLLIPIVFGNLSPGAQLITRNMLWVIAVYMPLWSYLNAQFATARAGGDAVMGVWVDVSVNIFLFLPAIFILAVLTNLGPIALYALVKITDFVKVGIAAWQLRTERWVKNMTGEHLRGEAHA
ncbi:MAG TPA: MATE family efflux transporter [Treponemataceae bacterium]|jgi:putative MATE family efflux protein|nr:MATE family efflux transporter [Treponemataceae bacterium]HQF72679.1 MATE family efflux transporter [Treponemataceae bacterium]HRR01543.1 MATE family efflux transporter [Treponemataceae bacterium]